MLKDLRFPITSDGEFIAQEALVSEKQAQGALAQRKKAQAAVTSSHRPPALSAWAADITSVGCGEPLGNHLSLAQSTLSFVSAFPNCSSHFYYYSLFIFWWGRI